jgi:hypothetical protein
VGLMAQRWTKKPDEADTVLLEPRTLTNLRDSSSSGMMFLQVHVAPEDFSL